MNIINVKINFNDGKIEQNNGNIIQNDYNSTKIIFEFDDQEGLKIFELKNPSGKTAFVQVIENNEILLGIENEDGTYGSIFTEYGDYVFEISLYKDNSKLTSQTGYLYVSPEQVESINDEIVEAYFPLFNALITSLNEEIEASSNLNIDAEKVETTTFVNLTSKLGETKTIEVKDGVDGVDGRTPDIKIGNVQTLEYNQEAFATIGGSTINPTLNLGIPRGVPGSGGGGTSNYNELENIPTMNGLPIKGNLESSSLGLQPAGNYAKTEAIPVRVTQLQNDANYVNGTGLAKIQKVTQTEYDALTTKDATTLYLIIG